MQDLAPVVSCFESLLYTTYLNTSYIIEFSVSLLESFVVMPGNAYLVVKGFSLRALHCRDRKWNKRRRADTNEAGSLFPAEFLKASAWNQPKVCEAAGNTITST